MTAPLQYYPDHVRGFVADAADQAPYKVDDFHPFYQVVCSCGSLAFQLYVSDKQSVKAQCVAWKHEIVLYDLSLYPAATKLPGPEAFRLLNTSGGTEAVKVFVMYEYSELERDVEFDSNDITWFQLWVESAQGELQLVIDDETA